MKFLEKDLEEIIFTSPVDKLHEKGLPISLYRKRQLRIGNYGIADIVTFERPVFYDRINYDEIININVYELKKDKISVSAFLQALNYIKGIQTYLKNRNFGYDVRYTLTLIGSELDTSGAFCFLPDLVSSDSLQIKFYTYSYGIDGIEFRDEEGYNLIDKGF